MNIRQAHVYAGEGKFKDLTFNDLDFHNETDVYLLQIKALSWYQKLEKSSKNLLVLQKSSNRTLE